MKDRDRKNLEPDNEMASELFNLLGESLQTLTTSPKSLTSLENRLNKRIHDSVNQHLGLRTVRARTDSWQQLTSGIRYKPLWQGTVGNSVLIEFAPGAALPVHRHNHLEEGIVLSGSLQVDDIVLNTFDYHVSPPGSHHGHIRSEQGGMAYLRGTSIGQPTAMLKELVTGFFPKNQLTSHSIKLNEIDWLEVMPGLYKKELWTDGETASCYFRLDPNTTLPGHDHPLDEECMMLSGELFLGDILVQAGDYHFAPKGTVHLDIYSDTGCLLYVKGAAARM